MRDKVLAALENKTNLPAFPLTAQKVLAHLANPKMNMVDLANSIKTDQAYTAVILRMVNSAGVGLAGSVTDVTHAINYLGLLEIRKMVYALSARSIFDQSQSYVSWSHALTSAYIGEMVAKANGCNVNDAFVSCLFHDTAKLFFYKKFPAATALAYEKAACDSIALIDCEETVLGIDHAEAGRLIMGSWQLGPSIGLAIQNHHRPYAEFSGDKLSCIVAFANQLAHQIEKPDDIRYELDEDLVNSLGLTPDSIDEIRQTVAAKVLAFTRE